MVTISVFIYMMISSISIYLPPAIAIGALVGYIYNKKYEQNEQNEQNDNNSNNELK
jgi:uncharacterized oligopeptide transporter (OPT) family protein